MSLSLDPRRLCQPILTHSSIVRNKLVRILEKYSPTSSSQISRSSGKGNLLTVTWPSWPPGLQSQESLSSNLKMNNCLKYLDLGDMHDTSKLKKLALGVEKADYIIKTDVFKDLFKEKPELAFEVKKALNKKMKIEPCRLKRNDTIWSNILILINPQILQQRQSHQECAAQS